MRYEGTVYRPPSEGDSVIIQATVGCPHNRCRFCRLYKRKKFRIRPVADILEDIATAGEYYPPAYVRTVFLADGNTVVMRTAQLLEILARIREVFPRVERVTSYGAAQYFTRKSPQEWRELREAGLSRIHCGMETGHDPLLALTNKGCTKAVYIDGCRRVRDAGIELSMYYLTGLGGTALWREHALDSAAVLNAVNPEFIRIRTFTPMPGTPMGDEFLAGTFGLPEPHAALRELRLLVENLDVTSRFYSDHWLNFADIHGILPNDKNRMLAAIDKALTLPRSAFREVGILPKDSL
ncbi:Radical SAM domain protein [uncultured delta proteobacterium]|uniref:Radical SAM domain protein n=1 Tax=uncultured delta proteobacterium TaxID=34034 RepID=A0A212KCP9_9DELT|nr:Radical SAM domain protein [uncultured delta proteobacterium]